MNDSPIQNLDRIDILGRRVDGGVDLVIVVSGPLHNTVDHIDCVRKKMVTYLDELASPQFAARFPESTSHSSRILFVTEHLVDGEVLKFVESFRPATESMGVSLKIMSADEFNSGVKS
jgi:hypothetical protein